MSVIRLKLAVLKITSAAMLAAACALWPVVLPAEAQQQYTEEEAERIAQEISENTMSPFCPGRTLSACPSGQARELRLEVRGWLDEGLSREEIRARLLSIYGEDVRGAPGTEGFGIMAWLVPVFVIILAFLFIVYALRSLRAKRELAGSAAAPVESAQGEELRKRVEDEVQRRME